VTAKAARLRGVIDACVFHEWPSLRALEPYLHRGWREVLVRPGDRFGPVVGASDWLYHSPIDRALGDSYPAPPAERLAGILGFRVLGGQPGTDLDLLCRQVLDGTRERAVLSYDDGLLATAFPNHHIARVIAQAANDWTANEWLARDRRLHGLILVCNAMPIEAAAEIRRAGTNDRFVGVAMGANALGRPFGHPVYHPIYEAATELDLPIIIQVGSDASSDQITPPVGGGLPATYGEYRALGFHSHWAHVSSLIIQGVFTRYPTLKVLLIGGGASWVSSFLWRLDFAYKTTDQLAPWLTHLPSDYFVAHFRVATYELEAAPTPDQLERALSTLPGIESILMYTSCYPNVDAKPPGAIAKRLPEAWHARVFAQNAREFFRWPHEGGAGLAQLPAMTRVS
jgi:predicted TIM-barrel fold metal-dependent hydrolase